MLAGGTAKFVSESADGIWGIHGKAGGRSLGESGILLLVSAAGQMVDELPGRSSGQSAVA